MSEKSLSFLDIMENIKKLKNLRKDVEVAELLSIKPVTLSQQKLRNSIPHNEVIDFCINEGFSLDTVYGLSEMTTQGTSARRTEGLIFCKDADNLEAYLKTQSVSCRLCLDCIGISPKDTVAFECFDDTMEPIIKNGDTVIVDLLEKEIKDNGIFLVSYGGQYSLKRFVFTFADTVIVKGDNPMAMQFELPVSKLCDITVVGRATKVLSVKKI